MHTYNFDSVSRCGCDVPGALFPAGVLVWPVWAAQGPTGTVDLVLTLGWRHTHKHARAHTERKFKNHGCTGKGQRKWKRNRKERNTRTK